jgi:nitroimidazol reductase NimA-like FMN-containing flavoprotein (pyridoxamine 5'-phosphate oxidase superfamily)
MTLPRELAFEECVARLSRGVVGRVALPTPHGPQIVPLNYSMVDDAIIVATSPYSVLGTYGPGSTVAFEIDDFDDEQHAGWSVVVRGRADAVADHGEVQRLKQVAVPRPWAGGSRNLFLRIRCTEVSGRSVGPEATPAARRTVATG